MVMLRFALEPYACRLKELLCAGLLNPRSKVFNVGCQCGGTGVGGPRNRVPSGGRVVGDGAGVGGPRNRVPSKDAVVGGGTGVGGPGGNWL
jgi:hypothetical protein